MKSFHEFLEEKNLNEDLFGGLKGAWQGFKQGWQGNKVKQQRNRFRDNSWSNLVNDFIQDSTEWINNSDLPEGVKDGLLRLQSQYLKNTANFLRTTSNPYSSQSKKPVNVA
jgi:hypothetical protein